MRLVVDIALKYQIDVRIGIYGTMAFFDTTSELLAANDFIKQIPQNIHQTQENYDYLALYEQWRGGHLRLRCQSILSSLVIHSNGNVPLCQNLDVVLGNIHEQSLDDIFNGQSACQTQCRYSHDCNGCWINFHRKYDIILVRNLERLLPRWLIKRFYGAYQWTSDPKQNYSSLFK
jgi:MoaA/NifB/PqqE/SkfB family radical SAM enzyme